MNIDQMRELVKECGLDWHRGFMPLFDGDETNRYAVLIEESIESSGLQAEVERLTAENAELRKDAERYRWLRKSNSSDVSPHIARDFWNSWGKLVTKELRNKAADDQIDKAMKETP